MPFDPRLDEVYEAIKCAVESDPWNFVCRRADDFFRGGHLLADVLRGIGEAQSIIADLTGRNPNVFYELGIAHMVKQPSKIVLLTRDTGSLPFDVQSFRCIQYTQTIQAAKKLQEDIRRALNEVAHPGLRLHRGPEAGIRV